MSPKKQANARHALADSTSLPPFETRELRKELTRFLNTKTKGETGGKGMTVGSYKFGVYAFFDYDGEPIYVGQTSEKISTRIRRHLTNQRTDAVAMNVLDPFEVCDIEVWPLVEYQERHGTDREACERLNALEAAVCQKALADSQFKAVLNEKEPASPHKLTRLPRSIRGTVVSSNVREVRGHPDTRIARRAATLARLAQVISERKVQSGLRKTLLTQAKRLQWLADRRYQAFKALIDEGLSDESDIDLQE